MSLLRLSQVLLCHISLGNADKVNYETRIPLFPVLLHFQEDLFIKLRPGMGLDRSFLDPVSCWENRHIY